jgi:hypothetical protein
MKKLLLVAAVSLLSASPVLAGSPTLVNASRGGVANSANVTQTAGAAAIAIVAQGERATVEAPHHDPLILFESGSFVMPYISESFNASRGGEVRNYDPIGSYVKNVDVNNVP